MKNTDSFSVFQVVAKQHELGKIHTHVLTVNVTYCYAKNAEKVITNGKE